MLCAAAALFALLLASAAPAAPRALRGRQSSGRNTIDVVNAEIPNLLRLVSDVAGVSFVVGDDVAGTVTVRLRDVPWRAALRAILRSKALEMVQEGDIIRVARRSELAAERAARLDARARCLEHGPLRTRVFRPSYARAGDLVQLLQHTLTPRGRIVVDERTNTLIVRDVICR